MSDTPVILIANLTISDADTYRLYEKGFFPVLKKHGGEFITYDDAPELLEGTTALEGRVVIWRFPNEAVAKAWYDDPEYQAISEHRRAGTSLNFLTLVHGTPPRG